MLEGSKRRKVRSKERLLLQRVSWLPPWVDVGNSHDARAPAGAPSVRGFENHASLRVRRAIKKIETQRHRAIASSYGHAGRETRSGGGLGEMTRRKREIVGLRNERDFPYLVELALPPGG